MQDRPTAGELLEAVAEFLVTDVEPHVPDWLRFQLRVARNSLAIVQRELAYENEHLIDEWAGLDTLLGEQPIPQSPREQERAVVARNEELCRRIGAGNFDQPDARRLLLDHLRAVVHNKLVISNPRYVSAQ